MATGSSPQQVQPPQPPQQAPYPMQPQSYLDQPPQRGSNCLKIAGIGCLVVVLLGLIGGCLVYRFITGKVDALIAQFTENQPRQLPKVDATPEAVQAVRSRIENFGKAAQEGKAVEPLVLTGDDINILIQNDPAFKEAAGKIHVAVVGDTIKGEASIPLGDMPIPVEWLAKRVKGRYLNGTITFRAELKDGQLALFAEEIEVKGERVPEQFMKDLRGKNLAKDTNTNPEFQKAVQNIESVKVENGKLIITPKKPGSKPASDSAPAPDPAP